MRTNIQRLGVLLLVVVLIPLSFSQTTHHIAEAKMTRSPSTPAPEARQSQQPVVIVQQSPPPKKDDWDKAGLLANWALVAVGIVAGLVTWRTLVAIKAQTKVATEALVASLRPKLIVRKVTMTKGTMIPVLGMEDAHPWTVDFDIANIGMGPADVIDFDFRAERYKDDEILPDRMEYVGGGVDEFRLEPGEDRRLSIRMPEDLVSILRIVGDAGLAQGWQNTNQIYFYGVVVYKDLRGVKRNTAVARHYDNALKRFAIVDDIDREYAD